MTEIPNFLLVLCTFDMDGWDTPQTRAYYAHNSKYHALTLKRIRELYPETKIHVLTNEEPERATGVTYHVLPTERNGYCKLEMFSMIDGPCMFVDNDVLLVRRFTEEELPDDAPFNVYTLCPEQLRENMPPILKEFRHYNTGVVWLPRHDDRIVSALNLAKERFRHVYKNGWVNDEFPISYVIQELGLKMSLFDAVNKYRSDIKACDIGSYQSVHYTGPEVKQLYDQESRTFDKRMML
jgi:hypothetical protein